MRYDDDARALADEPAHELAQLAHTLRVESRRRLVEDVRRRSPGGHARERHAPHLPAGELERRAVE